MTLILFLGMKKEYYPCPIGLWKEWNTLTHKALNTVHGVEVLSKWQLWPLFQIIVIISSTVSAILLKGYLGQGGGLSPPGQQQGVLLTAHPAAGAILHKLSWNEGVMTRTDLPGVACASRPELSPRDISWWPQHHANSHTHITSFSHSHIPPR